ncbi:hypothetical protein POM88_041197 [Heracleum sosnowskyi]|uniref:Uncharacterized protein n=1 Tax=Heracleum sosnowskyi TaxID=360622 RepID=A0AAD8HFQ9_9APIA|nr:hypothetical protein POM88_041197 [Heracleum sosnowskyi]
MTTPSLLKHEQTIKALEAQVAANQTKNSEKHEETLLQLANLTAKIAEMGAQFQGVVSQMQADRDLMTKQLCGLSEQFQAQATSIQPLLQQHYNASKPSSSITSVTTNLNTTTTTDNSLKFGNIPSSTQIPSTNTNITDPKPHGNPTHPTSIPPGHNQSTGKTHPTISIPIPLLK